MHEPTYTVESECLAVGSECFSPVVTEVSQTTGAHVNPRCAGGGRGCRYIDKFTAVEVLEPGTNTSDPNFPPSCPPRRKLDYTNLPSCDYVADGGFEEPTAVRNATYCDTGGQVTCTHVLPPRRGEQIVGYRSDTSNKGRSFETHYADTFNATGTAPLHSCSLGQHDGAKIGVSG